MFFCLKKSLFLAFLITLINSCQRPPTDDNDQPLPNFDRENRSDEALMDTVQRQTFKYFWDFAHPKSGMILERYHPTDQKDIHLITTGGTGFGIMAIITGITRNYITRSEGLNRIQKMVDFLEKVERYHGAFSHWYDGQTSLTVPFSAKDDGGDLVETSFLIQGLLSARTFFNGEDQTEVTLRQKITKLYHEVEWDWYTNNRNQLYWHWSPKHHFEMNFSLKGWMETLITYVLASSSPTHSISPNLYHQVWAQGTNFKNGNQYYSFELPLGPEMGGPLFFAHYSFLGLNPNIIYDEYADYYIQNKNHTLINRAYCIDNPLEFPHYGENCWGLTASYSVGGYEAHSPTNDIGVISPTAAISSMPYTPKESMDALRHFFFEHPELWGEAGFYDAFSVSENWVSDGYLAIDQGPIIIMIENHRSSLLWNLFMSNEEIIDGLTRLGFKLK